MPQQDYIYASVVMPILNVLKANPGTFFTAEEISQQVDCTPLQVRVALTVLVHMRLVQKEASVGGNDRYMWDWERP